MNKRNILIIIVIILAIGLFSSACNAKSTINYDCTVPSATPVPDSSYYDSVIPIENSNEYIFRAGQLSAAELRDNNNYNEWLNLLSNQGPNSGEFNTYYDRWKFDTSNRIIVNVTNNSNIVSGAAVKVFTANDTLLFSGRTDRQGKAHLFPKNVNNGDVLRIEVSNNSIITNNCITYNKGMEEVNIAINQSDNRLNKLEIMFVIDTTGSMGDELNYLKGEIKDVISKVKVANPTTDVTVALLFYRDKGDEYVTRYFNFTSNIDNVKTNISNQSANGGGDYPEAVHTALSEAVSKQWSSGNSTKLIIHVLDAPPHDKTNEMLVYENSIYTAAEKGIRMIPVASSGIDKPTEYLLRNQAMLTGGTYVFLTDDSGIGGGHLEPAAGSYVVEYLNALLVRVINEYHTGVYVAPVPYYQQ